MKYRDQAAEAVEVFLAKCFRYLVNRDKYAAAEEVTSKRARVKKKAGKNVITFAMLI
jgi:hypothetical protein